MHTLKRLICGLLFAVLCVVAGGRLTPTSALAQDAPPPDRVAPEIARPANLAVTAADAAGTVVAYPVPTATDAVDGPVPVACAPAPGAFFSVGRTVVTCTARDAANNAASVDFAVTVAAPPPPVPTEPPPPAPTQEPVATEPPPTEPIATATETPTVEPEPTEESEPTKEPDPTKEPEPTEEPKPTEEPDPIKEPASPADTETSGDTEESSDQPDEAPATATPAGPAGTDSPATSAPPGTPVPNQPATPTRTPAPSVALTTSVKVVPGATPAALALPWPAPESFVFVSDGGPLDGLAAIWRNQDFGLSQEFGHTAFSVAHPAWYAYGRTLGLDGYAHTGLDVGMPAGTWLYSPVEGTVTVAGGTPYFTFYGNGGPGVGQLQIETDDGDIVILGHMGRIVVDAGQRVEAGQFVGLSGGDNGDHLHLETRERQPGGGYRLVDPRDSFLVAAIAKLVPFELSDGQVVIEAEAAQETIDRDAHRWTIADDQSGFDGEGFVVAGPDSRDAVLTDYAETSPQLRFTVTVDAPGTYTLWLRGSAPKGGSDSVHYGLDGDGLTSRYGVTGFGKGTWTWVAGKVSIEIDTPGTHVIELWMREDGLRIDRLVLTSDPAFVPDGAEAERPGD